MDLLELSHSELYALYNMAKEMQIKEYNKAGVNPEGFKESSASKAAFKRICLLEAEINNRLEQLD